MAPPVPETLVIPERELAHTFHFEDVLFTNYEHEHNPAYESNIVSHLNILTDIAATISEHGARNFSSNDTPSAVSVLVSTANESSPFHSFLEYFIITLFILTLNGAIFGIIYICYNRGCYTMFYDCCCKRRRPNQPR